MAQNREAFIIILDVGENSTRVVDSSNQTLLEKEKECCTKLLQKKIFEGKKDEVALILMGTDETQNRLNDESAGYENICETFSLNIPDWNLIRAINRCSPYESIQANWLDALSVAIAVLNGELIGKKKFGAIKIVLFTSFTSVGKCSSEKTVIVQDLKNLGIDLIVISDNIEFCFEDGADEGNADGPSQATFTQMADKPLQQTQAERLILDIIEETDGNLTSFQYLIDHLMHFQKKRSRLWYWNTKLEIGKDLEMQIAATISIKAENHFKFSTTAKDENMILFRGLDYFKNGENIEPSAGDLLKGYMIGSTPIPYDETLGIKKHNTNKGLRCLAFTKSSTIPPQLLCGNGTYLVMAKEGDGKSQKLFRLLVEAMIRVGHSMIASKVYLNGHKPKLVALTPNKTTSFPTLNMYEMVYADQVHHWYFPQLCTKKTQPSPEQYLAVEQLIDAMDLMDAGEGGGEAFPHNKLVSPAVQNIYETVTKRALDPTYKVEVFDHRLQQALKVPQLVLERSAEAIKNIKEQFTLEAPKIYKKELVRKLCLIPVESDGGPQAYAQYEFPEETKKILEVGTVTPEEDFKTLLNEDMSAFPKVSEQLANVLFDLIFKTMTDQSEKVRDAMITFREYAKFYGPYVYTDWIRNVKTTAVTRRKMDFWENVVVRNRLGIISASESEQVASVTNEEAEEFYRVNVGAGASAAGQDDEADVDDLFGQM